MRLRVQTLFKLKDRKHIAHFLLFIKNIIYSSEHTLGFGLGTCNIGLVTKSLLSKSNKLGLDACM